MRLVFKLFFRLLRLVLGPFVLLGEFLGRPRGIVRPPVEQEKVDEQCRQLAVYQFSTCPFCVRVRQEIRRLSLDIALLDARTSTENRAALLQGGGRVMVPCLKITDAGGQHEWLYESGAIIAYLRSRFADGGT